MTDHQTKADKNISSLSAYHDSTASFEKSKQAHQGFFKHSSSIGKNLNQVFTDAHTHIGRFYQTNYEYKAVFNALKANGVQEITCAYLTPKFDEERLAEEFYYAVLETLAEAKSYAKQIGLTVNFLAWLDPLVLKSEIRLNEIWARFEYGGFALHPVLHDWTGNEAELLTHIFQFAEANAVQLFIHTGISENDNPLQFERWFADFSEVRVRLAHCKDAEPIIKLFGQHKNLTGDTAFCPNDSFHAICNAGFRERMYFGTDFPITHWWQKREATPEQVSEAELTAHYRELMR